MYLLNRKRVAVLMASVDREYQQDFAAGLTSAGAQNDIDICIFNSQGHMNVDISTSEAGECQIYDLPDLSAFDGIISMPATMGNNLALQKLAEVLRPLKGKPHVSIDVPQDGAVTICFDDRMSVEALTEHMIERHRVRRIAVISGPRDSSVAQERVKAIRDTMERHGLTLEENMLFDGEWTRVGGRQAAETILQRGGELPDAILCGNDDMALSVIEYFTENGIQIPGDLAVTGFDALRESIMRGLTTICRPIDRSARKAIEILRKWIDGEKPEEMTIRLSTIPIYGESCGCSRDVDNIQERLRAFASDRWNLETILTKISMFSSTMAGVGDEEEARAKIHDFIRDWGIGELYLCVDPAVCRDTGNQQLSGTAYPEEMLLLYGTRGKKAYDTELFETTELTPSLQEPRKRPSCLVFCPLYYRDRTFGYVAMDFGRGTGSALYSVLMLLNGTLMSLYLQTSIKKSAATIERMADHDIMTGMQNRRGYMKQAPGVMEKARRSGKVFVLMSGDMNHMKDINDKFGHMAGDEAICRMGRALRIAERKQLIPVHISGDEFLVYGLVDQREEAESLIPLVQSELERINREEPWHCDISVSLGLYARVPQDGDNIDAFMIQADKAMYEEKNRHKYGRRKEDFEKQLESRQ